MINIKIFEEVVSLLAESKNHEAILRIEALLEEAKKKGRHNLVKTLKSLTIKIPTTTLSAQSVIQIKPDKGLYERVESDVLLEDVIVDEKTKDILTQFVNEWQNRGILKELNLEPANRILLYGKPGTGKTKLAYGIANKLDLPLVLVQLDELVSSFLGKTGKNLRDIFEVAKNEQVIIFLDEIDTVAKHRADDKDLGELKRVVTVLLQNIDSFSSNSILIGATNHEELLDRALWRRFPIKAKLSYPDQKNRELLYKLFLKNFKIKTNVDLKLISILSEGLSGYEIFEICNGAMKNTILSREKKIDVKILLKSILNNINNESKLNKKNTYEICRILNKSGFSITEISKISNIPYSTLADNLK